MIADGRDCSDVKRRREIWRGFQHRIEPACGSYSPASSVPRSKSRNLDEDKYRLAPCWRPKGRARIGDGQLVAEHRDRFPCPAPHPDRHSVGLQRRIASGIFRTHTAKVLVPIKIPGDIALTDKLGSLRNQEIRRDIRRVSAVLAALHSRIESYEISLLKSHTSDAPYQRASWRYALTSGRNQPQSLSFR